MILTPIASILIINNINISIHNPLSFILTIRVLHLSLSSSYHQSSFITGKISLPYSHQTYLHHHLYHPYTTPTPPLYNPLYHSLQNLRIILLLYLSYHQSSSITGKTSLSYSL